MVTAPAMWTEEHRRIDRREERAITNVGKVDRQQPFARATGNDEVAPQSSQNP